MSAAKQITLDLADEQATSALARVLAEILPAGTTVTLHGTLGAGKTRLVQEVAAALGVAPGMAVSPTFVLMNEYQGRHKILHLDAYRLRDEDEFRELGAEEFFASGALVFIEWAERVAGCLPEQYLSITLAETGLASRRCTVADVGGAFGALIEHLAAWNAARRN